MVEVEVKVKIEDMGAVREMLEKAGFRRGKTVSERDLYYTGEVHDFRKCDEALRIRTTAVLDDEGKELRKDSFVTYKGPKLDGISMTRTEDETRVEDAEVLDHIFRVLGLHAVMPVHKVRTYYAGETAVSKSRCTVCLDEVDGLGSFMEVEILTDDGSKREEMLREIESVLSGFGLTMEQTVRTSYLSMLEGRKGD